MRFFPHDESDEDDMIKFRDWWFADKWIPCENGGGNLSDFNMIRWKFRFLFWKLFIKKGGVRR